MFNFNGMKNVSVNALANKGISAYFTFRKYLLRFPNISPAVALKFFNSLVVPVINYGCQIWGFREEKKLERIPLKFYKFLLGVKQSTPDCFIYGELGQYPLFIKQRLQILKYWLNIIKAKPSKFTGKMYLIMLSDIERNNQVKNWASQVRDLLYGLGFGGFWLDQRVDNELWFIRSIEQRMKDQYTQHWLTFLDTSNKAIYYRGLKLTTSYEPYLDKPRLVRAIIARFRCSSHDLLVETGRWTRPKMPYEDRKCAFCNMNVIEDEYHFVLVCPAYTNLRSMYIERRYWSNPNVQKFISLFTNTTHSESLASFLWRAAKARSLLAIL